jgi:hypothetical protein
MPPRRPRNSTVRDIVASLALVVAIFVSILALPFGKTHEAACRVVSTLANRPGMPCGISALSITIDTDRRPWFSIAIKPLRLPISL